MFQAKYCELCEFPKKDLETGLVCGLTNKKPDFKTSCPDIKFSKSFKEYLPKVLNQLDILKKRKIRVYLEFIFRVLIGLAILVGNRSRLIDTNLLDFSYSNYLEVLGTLLIVLIAGFCITSGVQIFRSYRKELNQIQNQISEIEMVLQNYNLDIETILNHK